ncbi:MAG: hypothetical protein ACRD1P_13340 [Thermoanaerobaculia bacterium]
MRMFLIGMLVLGAAVAFLARRSGTVVSAPAVIAAFSVVVLYFLLFGGRDKFGNRYKAPLGFLWERLGRSLPGGEVRIGSSGITAPDLALVASGRKPKARRLARSISWSEVSHLRLSRDPYGEIVYEFEVPETPPFLRQLAISRSDLYDPEGFERAVEQRSGRRFEKTFEDLPAEIEPGAASEARDSADEETTSTLSMQQVVLEHVEALQGATSFRIITVGMNILGTVVGILVGLGTVWFLWRFAPPAVGRFATSSWGFVVIVFGGWAAGHFWLRRSRQRYRLAVAQDGLYARAPSRRFPGFTPWKEIIDFTYTKERVRMSSFRLTGGSDDPPHRFTLRTTRGTHSFVCQEIESDSNLVIGIQEFLKQNARRQEMSPGV